MGEDFKGHFFGRLFKKHITSAQR